MLFISSARLTDDEMSLVAIKAFTWTGSGTSISLRCYVLAFTSNFVLHSRDNNFQVHTNIWQL